MMGEFAAYFGLTNAIEAFNRRYKKLAGDRHYIAYEDPDFEKAWDIFYDEIEYAYPFEAKTPRDFETCPVMQQCIKITRKKGYETTFVYDLRTGFSITPIFVGLRESVFNAISLFDDVLFNEKRFGQFHTHPEPRTKKAIYLGRGFSIDDITSGMKGFAFLDEISIGHDDGTVIIMPFTNETKLKTFIDVTLAHFFIIPPFFLSLQESPSPSIVQA